MRTSALFGAKNFWIFQNLWYIRTDKGLEPASADIFQIKGERGSIFHDYFQTSFMDGLGHLICC